MRKRSVQGVPYALLGCAQSCLAPYDPMHCSPPDSSQIPMESFRQEHRRGLHFLPQELPLLLCNIGRNHFISLKLSFLIMLKGFLTLWVTDL